MRFKNPLTQTPGLILEKEVVGMTSRKVLPRCQYGVPAPTEEGVDDCGEPAVAFWDWSGIGDVLYVCEKHDEIIAAENQEETPCDSKTR